MSKVYLSYGPGDTSRMGIISSLGTSNLATPVGGLPYRIAVKNYAVFSNDHTAANSTSATLLAHATPIGTPVVISGAQHIWMADQGGLTIPAVNDGNFNGEADFGHKLLSDPGTIPSPFSGSSPSYNDSFSYNMPDEPGWQFIQLHGNYIVRINTTSREDDPDLGDGSGEQQIDVTPTLFPVAGRLKMISMNYIDTVPFFHSGFGAPPPFITYTIRVYRGLTRDLLCTLECLIDVVTGKPKVFQDGGEYEIPAGTPTFVTIHLDTGPTPQDIQSYFQIIGLFKAD